MKQLAILVSFVVLLSACQVPLVVAPTTVPAEPTAVVVESPDEAPRIALDEAKRHFDMGTALFVDSRSAGAYQQQHITDALSLPFNTDITGTELPKDRLIITYCT